ncbi:MAG: hypothetical protein ACYC2U_08845 [Candidatus Amoebophilus sp.]
MDNIMPNTFLDELTQLNQMNFLGGIAQAAQASKEKVQNDTMVDVYNKLRTGSNELKTRDQQLSDLNSSVKTEGVFDPNNPATVNFDMLNKVATNYAMAIKQEKAYTDLYFPAIATLSAMDIPGAKELANSLTRELATKKDDIETMSEIPLKEMEYKSRVLDISKNVLNIQTSQLALTEAKKQFQESGDLKDLMTKMMTDPDGQQLLRWGTGVESVGTVIEDDPKVKETTDRLYVKYTNNPMFQSAITLIAGGKNFYRRSILIPSGTGTGASAPLKDDAMFVKLFSSLQDDSKLWNLVHSSNDYPYTKAREILFGGKDEKGNTIPPTGLDGITDDVLKNIINDYVNSFMKSGDKDYSKRFNDAASLAKKYGKTLGPDFILPQYGISGKDILYFDRSTNKAIYEPYLYYQGYYQKQSQPGQQNKSLFAPKKNNQNQYESSFSTIK